VPHKNEKSHAAISRNSASSISRNNKSVGMRCYLYHMQSWLSQIMTIQFTGTTDYYYYYCYCNSRKIPGVHWSIGNSINFLARSPLLYYRGPRKYSDHLKTHFCVLCVIKPIRFFFAPNNIMKREITDVFSLSIHALEKLRFYRPFLTIKENLSLQKTAKIFPETKGRHRCHLVRRRQHS
jgi:hypothetical protein